MAHEMAACSRRQFLVGGGAMAGVAAFATTNIASGDQITERTATSTPHSWETKP